MSKTKTHLEWVGKRIRERIIKVIKVEINKIKIQTRLINIRTLIKKNDSLIN